MTWIAGHAAGDIGFDFPRAMARQAALRKRVQLLFVGNRAGTILIEHGCSLSRNVRDKAVAPFEMLLSEQLLPRSLGPGGR